MSCVLITGATGAVGSALIPAYLKDGDTEVRLLIRAESTEQLTERLHTLVTFWRAADLDKGQFDKGREERIQAFAGDVRLPRWGLSEPDYRRLSREVTQIIHAAGNVRLNQPLDEARRSAVESVRHAIAFAKTCRDHGQLRKLDVLSTVGVAGKMPGLVREQPVRAVAYHNTYEQSKAEAEDLLLKEVDEGLPVTIYRPSMVVGDSRTGRIIHFQVFYHLCDFFCGLRTEGTVPDAANVKLDVIPVDYVARAIRLASLREDGVGKIFHLCSGPERSWTLSQYSERLREMLARRDVCLPQLQKLSIARFRQWLVAAKPLADARTMRFLQGLPYLLDYLDQEQLFDNQQSNQFLSAAGLRLPAVEEYIETIMDAYWCQARLAS